MISLWRVCLRRYLLYFFISMRSGVFFLLFWVVYCSAPDEWTESERQGWENEGPTEQTSRGAWTERQRTAPVRDASSHPTSTLSQSYNTPHNKTPARPMQRRGGTNFARSKAPTLVTYSRRRAALGSGLRALQRDNHTNTLLLGHRRHGTCRVIAPRRFARHRRRRTHAGLAQEGGAQIQCKRHWCDTRFV